MVELSSSEIAQVSGGLKWSRAEMSDNVEIDPGVPDDTRMMWAAWGNRNEWLA
jgi:hypothetical protein